jgi:alpha-1,2-mannosyltransferase
MALLGILFSLLLSVLVSVIFLPRTLRFLCELVGHHLRRSCRTRRELLLARVADETKKHEAQQRNKHTEDDDWEDVDTAAFVKSGNGSKADSDWDGIVGFFHPFWYDSNPAWKQSVTDI